MVYYNIGSRAKVMHGKAKQTGGGLRKKDLKYNKRGRIVSKKASIAAKRSNNLVKAGYVTKKGVFGVVKRGGAVSKSRKKKDVSDIIKILELIKVVKGNGSRKYRIRIEKLIKGKQILNLIDINNIIIICKKAILKTNKEDSKIYFSRICDILIEYKNKIIEIEYGLNIFELIHSLVVSYNISWATQNNNLPIPRCSESKFVEHCQKKYKPGRKYNGLSGCTNNVSFFLRNLADTYNNLEIIGLQESITNSVDIITQNINQNHYGNVFNVIHSKPYNFAEVSIIYNKTKLEDCIKIAEGDLRLGLGRPFLIIYFPTDKIIVINTHFPHSLDRGQYKEMFTRFEREIKTGMRKIKMEMEIDRIILTGDFNDHYNELNQKQLQIDIQLLKHTLICGDGTNNLPNTCCYLSQPLIPPPTPLNKKSDYIFDTNKQIFFGIPKIEYLNSELHSDHDPVMAISILKSSTSAAAAAPPAVAPPAALPPAALPAAEK